jgi:hypothetical protein
VMDLQIICSTVNLARVDSDQKILPPRAFRYQTRLANSFTQEVDDLHWWQMRATTLVKRCKPSMRLFGQRLSQTGWRN